MSRKGRHPGTADGRPTQGPSTGCFCPEHLSSVRMGLQQTHFEKGVQPWRGLSGSEHSLSFIPKGRGFGPQSGQVQEATD